MVGFRGKDRRLVPGSAGDTAVVDGEILFRIVTNIVGVFL
jgi:hypothetical protein